VSDETTTFEFRAAVAADVDAIERIQLDAIRHGTAGHYDADAIEAWAGAFNRDGFVEKVDRDEVWIAEDAGTAVGYVSLVPATLEIDSVYVAPESAGRGIGGALIEHILNVAREHELKSVWLDASTNAIPFYQRMEFAVTGEDGSRTRCGVTIRCTRMARAVD
jgi:ribosomal protein S18 acetylase RimI-like enzyme